MQRFSKYGSLVMLPWYSYLCIIGFGSAVCGRLLTATPSLQQNNLSRSLLPQGMIEKLNVDVGKTRKTTERTRPRQRNHPDVEELEDDVTRVTKQWTNCIENVVDR